MRVLGIDPGVESGVSLLDVVPRSTRALLVCSTRMIMTALIDCFERLDGKVDLVAIEVVVEVKPKASAGGIPARMATNLLQVKELEKDIERWSENRGVEVMKFPASEWRKAMIGKATATDRQIKAAFGFLRIDGLPKRTNEHARDAFFCAKYAAEKKRFGSMVRRTA